MTPEQIKAMQEENAKLKNDLALSTSKVTELSETITQKDAIIKQKTEDVVGARKKYQKLSELPPEDVEKMTDAEKRQKEENDLLFEQQEATAKQVADDRAKEVASRREAAVKAMVGENPDLAQKVLKNFEKIKDADAAYTPEEIGKFVGDAFNMLGEERPAPIHSAFNGAGAGRPPQSGTGEDFSATDTGKQLGSLLNLGSMQAPAGEQK